MTILGANHPFAQADGTTPLYSAVQRSVGQVFYVANSLRLNSIKLKLSKTGAPTGKLWLEIKPVEGGLPEFDETYYDEDTHSYLTRKNSELLGLSLQLDVSGLGAAPATVTFSFPTSPTLRYGVSYAFVLKCNGALSGANNVNLSANLVAPGYALGTIVAQNVSDALVGGSYAQIAGDLVFETYFEESARLDEQLGRLGAPPADCRGLQGYLSTLVQTLANYFPQTLPEVYGGTGENDYAKGDMLYSPADGRLARLPVIQTPGLVLSLNDDLVPEWGRAGGQVLQHYTNRAGTQLDPGDSVIYEVGHDQSVKRTTSPLTEGFLFTGVVIEPIARSGGGADLYPGIVDVRITGSCARGDALYPSTVAGRLAAAPGGAGPVVALASGTDGQIIPAFINAAVPSIPVGGTLWFPVLTYLPAGFLLCTGQAVSRATYARLFAAIGTVFGAGNGSTTFNIPDLRGRTPIGLDNMGGASANRVTAAAADNLGGAGGEENHLLIANEMPVHTHNELLWNNATGVAHARYYAGGGGFHGAGSVIGGAVTPDPGTFPDLTTKSAGGGVTHNNMPPYIAGAFIIRAV